MASAIQAGPRSELLIAGMTCSNCARNATDALQSVAGVASASVSLQDGRARVHWRADMTPDISALSSAVQAAGFEAKAVSPETKPGNKSSLDGWRVNVIGGLCVTIPLMVGEWIFHLGDKRWFHWAGFVLTLPLQIFGGARFYKGAWQQIKAGRSNMDTLVALGSTAAFGFGVYELFAGARGRLCFMEAASIITLISIGHWFEASASGRAEKSMRSLFALAPATARRARADGSETDAPVSELRPGDQIVLRPGDRIPLDGRLLRGQCSVDEAMLTGESVPVEKDVGSQIYAGTLNVNGHAYAEVTAVGEETAVARIVAAVERAQNSRADIQRLADIVSSVFVPIVVSVAIATGLWWGLAPERARALGEWMSHFLWQPHIHGSPLAAAILNAVAVLIVACPCAMGLATPAALMVAAHVAARHGILIRDGIALEKAGKITVLLADKTGTLTQGEPAVAATEGAKLPLAAALARGSRHPFSRAVAKLDFDAIELSDWREVIGSGVEAKVSASSLARLGSMAWLRQCGIPIPENSEFIASWSEQGATILGLSRDRELLALLALKDTVKPASAAAVRELENSGLRVFMVTGDNLRAAATIAKQAGIAADRVYSEIKPADKAELVRKLQSQGEKVAFVGDGINDAPALEQADLGIAVGRASDIAGEAADMVLLNSGIEAVPEALRQARATLSTIRQNLFWAFFYNAAAIPLAALGFLSPILCAAAMGFSDLIVLGNALRLRRFAPKKRF